MTLRFPVAMSVLAFPLVIGCAGAAVRQDVTEKALSDLRTRAAFDFQCKPEQLQVQELGNFSTQGVSGCGRRATYVYRQPGSWLMNTDEAAQPKP